MTLLEKLQKHTLRQQKESRYHNGNQNTTSFGKNYKTTIKINGYNMFAEWTDLDSRTLL
jgi:hypothetical protein